MANILVIDDDAELLDMLRLLLEQRGGHQTVLSADGADGLAKALADPPDLAIIDVMMPGLSGYKVCRQMRANPATASIPIIILTARGQLVDQQAASDAGADDYMVKPVMVTKLLERVNDLLTKRSTAKSPLPAMTIVLLSLRGGVGVTTLAVNLAAALAQTEDSTACLVDLCPSSGHIALQLGLRPKPNWSGLIHASTLDAGAVEESLIQHNAGLQVLASPVFPIVGQGLPQAVVQTTLEILQQRFAIIIVDTPSVLSEVTIAALETAQAVGLVVTAEASSIQTTIGTLRALKQWSAKFQIILNHNTPESQWQAEAVERALKRPLMWTIPFDPAQAQALARGTPLVLHSPSSPLAQAVQGLAQELARAARTRAVNR
ncbi:MAG: response regulator [Chloroflexota bacterium]|nr:response regulator [Chloroflexota bacterium]